MKSTEKIENQSQQQRKNKLHLIRLLFLVWFGAEIVFYILYWGRLSLTRFMSYLTEWGYIITVFFLVSSYFQLFRDKKLFTSKLFHVCLAIEFLITIFYWGVLYKFSDCDDNFQIFFNYSKHLIPFLYLLIEFSYYNLPLEFSSIYQLALLIACYAANNFFFTIFLEMNVYEVITWKDSTSLIYIGIALSLSMVGWTIFFHLNKKYQVVEKIQKKQHEVAEKIKEKKHQVAEKIKEKKHQVVEKIKNKQHQVVEQINNRKERVIQRLKTMTKQVIQLRLNFSGKFILKN